MMKRLALFAVGVVLLLSVSPALARGTVTIDIDPGVPADRAAIERAASDLAGREVDVAVYLADVADADEFDRRLEADGFLSGNLLRTSVVAIVVSMDDGSGQGYADIIYGDAWRRALDTENNVQAILDTLVSGLSRDDLTPGVVNALTEIGRSIDNPPVPGGGTNVNVGSGATIPLAVGGTAIAGLAIGTPLLLRARRQRQAYAAAATRHKDAREQAGVAIADLDMAMRTAREKARFDAVSYPPAAVQQLAGLMHQAEQLKGQVQVAFDDVGEQLARKARPTREEYDAAAGAYQQVLAQVQAAREPLDQAERMRAELDALAQRAPGEVDRPKKS